MKAYWALIKIDLKLAFRQWTVIFFTYVFPLLFFFLFGRLMDAKQGATSYLVVSMVLVLGILGNGLFGAGLRTVQEREQNILRRFKVAPISPTPYLVAAIITGWVIYLPVVLLVLGLANWLYGMAFPRYPLSFLILVTLGVMAFRALGLIVASVVSSAQESNVVINLLYLAMLFLSGATIPVAMLPDAAQIAAQFLPASYLVTGFQSVLLRGESLRENGSAVVALSVTLALGLFLSSKLFRWDKDQKIRPAAKAWAVAVLAPFLLLGSYEAYSHDQIRRNEQLWRQLQRHQTSLIRGARIIVGDGKVIESGGLLVKEGKIAAIYEGATPSAEEVSAALVEAAGKTVLPGLIDAHVHLAAPGGFLDSSADYDPKEAALRALASYLYCGVTAVKSAGDPLHLSIELRDEVNSGRRQGAELFICGPLFTARGGHGTEYFRDLPQGLRAQAEAEMLRMPSNPEEARRQVSDLAQAGVDGIKAVLDAGRAGMLFERLDRLVLRSIAEQARQMHLPLAVHTGVAGDVVDALDVQADSIEHGSYRELIPEEVFAKMAEQGAAYDATLSVIEAADELAHGKTALLDRSLVQQVGPAELLEQTRERIASGHAAKAAEPFGDTSQAMSVASENLLRAFHAGAALVTGSDAGNPLVFHGPTIHRELELWVRAGIPPAAALQAATHNAARLLRAQDRIGLLKPGYDADLLIVDGNPLEDIGALEHVSVVFFKGEQVHRTQLFQQH